VTWYRRAQRLGLARLSSANRKPVILVDLDETIAHKAKYPRIGKPYDGVQEALRKLRRAGYRVRIYTCRLNQHHLREEGREAYYATKKQIEDYLRRWAIPFDDLILHWEGKPFSDYTIDDKAVHFDGDWSKAVGEILGPTAARLKTKPLNPGHRDVTSRPDGIKAKSKISPLSLPEQQTSTFSPNLLQSSSHQTPVWPASARCKAKLATESRMGSGNHKNTLHLRFVKADAGYADDFSKSNNAHAAEHAGRFPATEIARQLGVPSRFVREYAPKSGEWHHTSKFYNVTEYYDLEQVREWLGGAEGREMLSGFKAKIVGEQQKQPERLVGVNIRYLVWRGTKNHPHATTVEESGVTIERKPGQKFLTITTPQGKIFKKMPATRGFEIQDTGGKFKEAWLIFR
jgi:hypothetical protein